VQSSEEHAAERQMDATLTVEFSECFEQRDPVNTTTCHVQLAGYNITIITQLH